MEDYEKKYKDSLGRAKNYHEGHTLDVNPQAAMEYVFPELREIGDERIRKAIKLLIEMKENDSIGLEPVYGASYKEMIAWLEKQGGQKPTDNICFNVGDWIVYDGVTYLITGVYTDGYTNDQQGFIPLKHQGEMRLWDIAKDAKDGDVLALNDKVFIYAHRKQLYPIAVAHCFVDSAGSFYFDGEFGYTEKGNSIHPAAKEQSDLLFSKMKEAGYEWDNENKELKKIEQKPAWSEEPISVIEQDGEKWVRVCALGEDFLIAAHDYRDGDKTKFAWEEACKIGTFSKKQGYIMLALKDEINAKLKEIGGEPLDFCYWSSSEYHSGSAWYVYFGSGNVGGNLKYYSYVARAVAAF